MKTETIRSLIVLTLTLSLMPALMLTFVYDSTNLKRFNVPSTSTVNQVVALNGGAK